MPQARCLLFCSCSDISACTAVFWRAAAVPCTHRRSAHVHIFMLYSFVRPLRGEAAPQREDAGCRWLARARYKYTPPTPASPDPAGAVFQHQCLSQKLRINARSQAAADRNISRNAALTHASKHASKSSPPPLVMVARSQHANTFKPRPLHTRSPPSAAKFRPQTRAPASLPPRTLFTLPPAPPPTAPPKVIRHPRSPCLSSTHARPPSHDSPATITRNG